MRGASLGLWDGGAGAYLAAGGRVNLTQDVETLRLLWPAPLREGPESVTLSLPQHRVLAEDDTMAILSL